MEIKSSFGEAFVAQSNICRAAFSFDNTGVKASDTVRRSNVLLTSMTVQDMMFVNLAGQKVDESHRSSGVHI